MYNQNTVSSNSINNNCPIIHVNINSKITPVNSTVIEDTVEMEMSKDSTCNSHISSHHNFLNKNKIKDNFNSNFNIEDTNEYNLKDNKKSLLECSTEYLKSENKRKMEYALNNNGSYKFNM